MLSFRTTLLRLGLAAFIGAAAARADVAPSPPAAPKPDTKPRNYPADPAPEAAIPAKWPQELHVKGNRLVSPAGTEVWLQGLAIPGLEIRPEGHGAVFSTRLGIDEWKANVIRLPVSVEFWFGRGQGQTDGGTAYRALVDSAVNMAANRGAYLVIDNHAYRAIRPEHLVFWKDVAEKYKNHPAVLFDIINEPHGITWAIWRDGGFVSEKPKKAVDESAFLSEADKKKNQGFDSPGMQAAVNLIRSTGAKNIIIAGGLDWAYDLSGIVDGYALVNKMSFIPLSAQEDPATWVPDMLGLIQKYRLNWTGWSFHAWATPVMISDWNYTPTPAWGVPAKAALSGQQFELKKLR